MLDVLFVVPTGERQLRQEVNGTMLLATKLLQAGFSAEILRFCEVDAYSEKKYDAFIEQMIGKIIEKNPKCLSFYTLWPYYHIALRLATEIKKKKPDMIMVFGGPQASATAEETLRAVPQVDYICADEGEITVVPFFRAVLSGDQEGLAQIPSLWYRIDGQLQFNALEHPLCDLNTLPYWDERLYQGVHGKENYRSKSYFMPIDVGRGCPYSCTFCATKNFWHRTYRLKTPERIIEEILYYYNKFDIRSFSFSHDAFTANQRLVDSVCDKLLELKLDICWSCTTRVDCISKELILKMQKAGMTTISIGVESGSERIQKAINKRLNLSVVREMTKFLIDLGLEVHTFFMHGIPEETEEDLNDTLELFFDLMDMGAHNETISFCRFMAHTDITQRYYDQLVLDPSKKILVRNTFGVLKEMDMIRDNKPLFTHFYYLSTPARDRYQYVLILGLLYQDYPLTMSLLRQTYNKDNLKFYHDFIGCNSHIFEQSMAGIMRAYFYTREDLVLNMLKDMDPEDALLFKSILQCEIKK